jgi:hypothetical protein
MYVDGSGTPVVPVLGLRRPAVPRFNEGKPPVPAGEEEEPNRAVKELCSYLEAGDEWAGST